MTPRVSVIIPCYRAADTLRRAAASALAGAPGDLELLLVDDGSPDDTPALCDALAGGDPRIRALHRENGGAGAARNTGLAAARGDWVLFLDADDELLPGLWQALPPALQARPGLVLFGMERASGPAPCPLAPVGDYRKRRDFRRRAGSGRYRGETRFSAQFREVERLAKVFECGFGVLVKRPHGFRRVDRRAASDRHNPVGTEFAHDFGAALHRFNRRVRLDVFYKPDFHARLTEIVGYRVQKAELFHRAAAYHDDGFFAFKVFQVFQSAFAVINISRQCES